MGLENNTIPPVEMIRNKLAEFGSRVSIWGVHLFTIDGYVIAQHTSKEFPEGIEIAISSMSAGLITIAEDFIRLIDSSHLFKSVLVDSTEMNDRPGFSVLLGQIADNTLISCIFPPTTQLGLLTFELGNLQQEIQEIISAWDVKLHSETLT